MYILKKLWNPEMFQGRYKKHNYFEAVAPQKGVMNREILESITSQVRVKLSDKSNNIIFQEEGKNAGLEMVGDLSVLLPKS